MLNGIIKSPMRFFDTTPIGRILARFSKDVDVLDRTLPHLMGGGIYLIFQVHHLRCKLDMNIIYAYLHFVSFGHRYI